MDRGTGWRGAFLAAVVAGLVFAGGCRKAEPAAKGPVERVGRITKKGQPLTLLGAEPKVGEKAPDFTVVANDLSQVHFSSFAGKVCIISSVPSLDTPVCDAETHRFNEEAGKLGDSVTVLTISMDLPFAQKRWCAAAGVKNLQTLSDYRDASFGMAYGVLIKDLRLLARAVFVVDAKGVIRYVQIVNELTDQPDFDAALKVCRSLIGETQAKGT